MIFVSFAEANRQLFYWNQCISRHSSSGEASGILFKYASLCGRPPLAPSCFFLQLVRLKKTVINDENIFPFSSVRSLMSLLTISAARREVKRSQFVFCRIKETVESIFRKLLLKRASSSLHIHTSSDKNVAEFVPKQRNRGNTFLFHSITSGKKLADMIFGKKSLNTVN